MTSGNGIARGDNKFPFIPYIARRCDTGGKIDRSPLHLLEMRVHLPQSRQHTLAMRIDNLRAFRNRNVGRRSRRRDLSVLQNHNRIFDSRPARSVNQPATHNCRDRCGLRGKARSDLRQVSHAIARGACNKSRQTVFIALSHGFEMVHLGIHTNQRDQMVLRVQP